MFTVAAFGDTFFYYTIFILLLCQGQCKNKKATKNKQNKTPKNIVHGTDVLQIGFLAKANWH